MTTTVGTKNVSEVIGDLQTKYGVFIDTLRIEARRDLEVAFKDLLARVPMITQLKWEQYTCYFCDGDPVYFSIREPCFKIVECVIPKNCPFCNSNVTSSHKFCSQCGKPQTATDCESEWLDIYELKSRISADQLSELKSLSSLLQNRDDILKIIFGDHIRIIVDPSGIHEEQYTDHD